MSSARSSCPSDQVDILADLVTNWLTNRGLPTTLTLDTEATQRDYAKLLSSV